MTRWRVCISEAEQKLVTLVWNYDRIFFNIANHVDIERILERIYHKKSYWIIEVFPIIFLLSSARQFFLYEHTNHMLCSKKQETIKFDQKEANFFFLFFHCLQLVKLKSSNCFKLGSLRRNYSTFCKLVKQSLKL